MRKASVPVILGVAFALGTGSAPAATPLAEQYASDAGQLVGAALASDDAWDKLTELCDDIGHRLSGSPGLERAVDWAAERMERDGLENVRRQPVLVPHWVRGRESATMIEPRRVELPMLGLGRSVGTPPEGITADVVVVPDFDAFDRLPPQDIRGRIVLWNAPFTSYSATVKYRWEGAARAAEKGAVASLIRSVAPRSLRSPHTGVMKEYAEDERPIPAAALTIEDAEMIARLAQRGENVRVHLEMEAKTLEDAESHNVIGEIVGHEVPHEIVVIGGHLDSWDVGQGAHDDGGGCIVSMEAAHLIRELGLRPRRTIRVVLWTNEENGTRGAHGYFESTRDGDEIHLAAIEADGGVEDPWGFGVTVWQPGPDHTVDEPRQERILEVMHDIARLLEPVSADSARVGGGGADVSPLMETGVPGVALRTTTELYWDIHHTAADTVDKVDPEALRRNVAAMAVMAYVLADMPGRLE